MSVGNTAFDQSNRKNVMRGSGNGVCYLAQRTIQWTPLTELTCSRTQAQCATKLPTAMFQIVCPQPGHRLPPFKENTLKGMKDQASNTWRAIQSVLFRLWRWDSKRSKNLRRATQKVSQVPAQGTHSTLTVSFSSYHPAHTVSSVVYSTPPLLA